MQRARKRIKHTPRVYEEVDFGIPGVQEFQDPILWMIPNPHPGGPNYGSDLSVVIRDAVTNKKQAETAVWSSVGFPGRRC